MGLFGMDGAVGLVIEPGTVRAVAVERTRDGVTVADPVHAEISVKQGDENYAEALVGAIDGLFDDNTLRRDRVVVAFNGSDAVLRRASLPFSDESRIRRTIKFEVEEALPFPVEECVVDFHVSRAIDGKSEILVAAAAKERVSELLEILGRCGINVVAVELDVAALANTAAWAGVLDKQGVIVDIGERTTRTVVVHDGDVVFWRVFRTRVQDQAGVAEGVASEIQRSLLSAGLDAEPKALYVSGSHPDLADIGRLLSQKTGVVAVSFPASGADEADAVALGCALKEMGFDASSVDLRQEEFAYHRKLEQLTPGLITLTSLVLVCGLLWNVGNARLAGLVSEQQELIRSNAADIWNEAGVGGPAPETTEEIAARLAELVNVMKISFEGVDRKAKRSVLDEWKRWSGRVPKGLDVVFDEMRMTQREIKLSGTTVSAAEAERLQAALNGSGQFKFELPEVKLAPGGRTRFTMRHEYEEQK